uniref:Uncharacterized protein n=1 Tax=viral metagenome TaxID=1070528 RepID=A0A6M3JYJ6_9ZZZZ
MRTRDAVIEYQKTLDNVGTLTKDLDLVDPVSALYLEFEATNGGTSNLKNWISDVITKIEVVNGAEVLYGLNLLQLESLFFYKTGRVPTMFPSEFADGIQRHGCLLLFGRHLWDPDYAMDFSRYANPQIKITSNLNAIRDVAADGFLTGTLKGSIIAKVMEDAPKPSQYLMAKEIKAWTSAASGEVRVDLPVDYTYRMLMLRSHLQGIDIEYPMQQLKLTFDSDKYVMLNRYVKQLDAEALALFGTGELKHDIFAGTHGVVRTPFNKEPGASITLYEQDGTNIHAITYHWGGSMYLNSATHAGAGDSTARKWTTIARGHSLHATLPVPFGLMDKPETWFDPAPYKKAEAVITENYAACATQVVLEQARPL